MDKTYKINFYLIKVTRKCIDADMSKSLGFKFQIEDGAQFGPLC
jgi:hypothetical protein